MRGQLRCTLVGNVNSRLRRSLTRTIGLCPGTISVVRNPLVRNVGGIKRLFKTKGVFLPRIIGATHAVGGTMTVLRPLVRTSGRRNIHDTKGMLVTAMGKSIRSVKGGVMSIIVTYGGCRVVSLNIVIPTRVVIEGTVRRGISVVKLDKLVAPSLRRVTRITMRLGHTKLSVPVVVKKTAASGLRATLGVTPICKNPIVRVGSTSRGTLMTTHLLGPRSSFRFIRELGGRCRSLHLGGDTGRMGAMSLRRTRGGGLGL